MADPWDVAKDGLGFAGTLLMTVPWARDLLARLQREWLRRLPASGALAEMIDRLAARAGQALERPRRADVVYMTLGLLLVAASFGISLWRGLFAGA